jgi:tetratricopeptide (TPR) repeat protein
MKRANDRALLLSLAALLLAVETQAQSAEDAGPVPSRPADASPLDGAGSLPLPGSAPSAALLGSTRDALIRAGDFAGALAPAEGVVAALAEDDPQLASQLMVLARIETEVGEYDTAETNYLRAVELVQRRDGDLSISLVSPYQALARTYIKSDQYPEAITALEQARHITQRNLGLFSLEQIGLLDDMTIAYLRAGDTSQAQRMQEARLETAIRHFGADNAQLIPFRYELANYYDRSRMRQHAREQYEAILTLEREEPDTPPEALLRPLRELVQVDILTGEDSGARLELTEMLAGDASISPRQRARALVALGDWEMVRNSVSSALDYYRQAHATFHSDPNAGGPFMAQPTLIDFVPPLSPVDRRARKLRYSWGTIVLQFDVSADAHISNVQVVSAEPAGVMEDAYARRLMETHVRPRLEDGIPVATDDIQLKHYFRYYVED